MLQTASDYEEVVVTCVTAVAEEEGLVISQALTSATRLLGADGVLDSLALVSLVVMVEERLREATGSSIALATAAAFSQRTSPFLTIGSLAAYARQLAEGAGAAHA